MTTAVPGLVSVGVPTYNRPEGLQRTLSQITAQTYRQLEIIVSDNASPNEEVGRVIESFKAKDARIISYRQSQNIGAAPNFNFVLTKATGEFFMWAADDDEWDERYVQQCLSNIGSAASAVSGARVLFRGNASGYPVDMPRLSPSLGVCQNLGMFLKTMAPGFIYGIHRRASIEWVLREEQYDWWDCYFVAKQIAEGGFVTFPTILLTLGIDSETYTVKPFHPKPGRVFRYTPFLSDIWSLISRQSQLSLPKKLRLMGTSLEYMEIAFFQFEGNARPGAVAVVRFLRNARLRLMSYYWRSRRRAGEIVRFFLPGAARFRDRRSSITASQITNETR